MKFHKLSNLKNIRNELLVGFKIKIYKKSQISILKPTNSSLRILLYINIKKFTKIESRNKNIIAS